MTARPKLMGVINVTPDSFSDGGKFTNIHAGLAHAKQLFEEGADILDIGGESTRPGALRVALDEEIRRVVPLVVAIRNADWFVAAGASAPEISIDTMNHRTALAAVEAGATYVNDVSGGKADEFMLSAVAATDAKFVLSHWRGFSQNMDSLNQYQDVAADVTVELATQLQLAMAAGIARDRIILDPGLGFAKNAQQNWDLLAGLDKLAALGLPILIGASRKRFIAASINASDPASVGNEERDAATAALTARLAAEHPANIWGFRVHNVAANVAALASAAAAEVAGGSKEQQG